jgi:hypothetical protein
LFAGLPLAHRLFRCTQYANAHPDGIAAIPDRNRLAHADHHACAYTAANEYPHTDRQPDALPDAAFVLPPSAR